jgi:ABC-type transporter MlaC component
LIFKYINTYNTPSKIIKYKNETVKHKFKGLKNNTLSKRYSTSKLYTGKKTFRKPFNKNLSSTFSNALLANSNNNYNKDKLEIVNL